MDNKFKEQMAPFAGARHRGEAGAVVPPNPTFVGEGEAKFSVGELAKYPYAVQYQGPYETLADGTCRAVRLHARALADTGIPVLLQSFSRKMVDALGETKHAYRSDMDPSILEFIGDLQDTSTQMLAVRIKHLVVYSADQLQQQLLPPSAWRLSDGDLQVIDLLLRNTIVYSVWERTVIPDGVARILARVGECWVPCEQNAELLRQSGVERVYMIPHPYDASAPMAKLVKRPAMPGRRFYAIGAWQPRKGFHALIGAFLFAFRPGDDVFLTIKTTKSAWPDYPDAEASVRYWLATPYVRDRGWRAENVPLRIIRENISEDEILRLHHDNNIYVSSSHGEAFNLGAFDAKVAGNRMVHVPFGGTKEFAGAGDVEVPYELGPVHHTYRWGDSKWATYHPADLVRALQVVAPPTVYERPNGALDLGQVGALMRERVLRVARDTNPAAYEAWK